MAHGDSVYLPEISEPARRLSLATGEVQGTFRSVVPPAFDGDMGYFLASERWDLPWKLSAINQTTGTVAWTSTGDGKYVTPPIVVDGKVIIGSTEGQVTALDQETGAQVWSASAGIQIGGWQGPNPNRLVALTAADGLLLVPSYDTLVAFGG